MSNLLVIGSSGQIGTALMRICCERSIAATGLDIRPNRWDEKLTDLCLDFLVYEPSAVSHFTDIVFLATHPSARELEKNALQNEKDYRAFNHAKICAKRSGARLSIVSSQELFGIVPEKIDVFTAHTVYEKQKKDFESELYELRKENYRTGVLRVPIVFGGYDTDLERIPRLVPRWCQQALAGEPIDVTNPHKTVLLTLVDDVVVTLLDCLFESGKSFLKEVSGTSITIGHLAKLIKEVKDGNKKNDGALEMIRRGIVDTFNNLRGG